MNKLLKSTCDHEGFESKPYQDILGVWTFGHGLTFITKEESMRIVEERLAAIMTRLASDHPWLLDMPQEVSEVLCEMCYQLGYTGCHNFKNMWGALKDTRYEEAAAHGLDSKWASPEQTPERANELMDIIRGLA